MLLNLALLALAGSLLWILRANWIEAQARERAVLQRKVAAKTVLAPPPLPGVKNVAPAEYIDVAGKMLFSKDRNPTVVVEAPKPPPEPVMPALPGYHGQMAIGEPVILLSTSATAAQRGYRAGDQVGDFKLVSFDDARVDFEWKGKNVERKLEELRPKETSAPASAQNAGAASASAGATPVRSVASLDHPPPVAAAASTSASSTPAPAKGVTSLSGTGNSASNASAADTSGDSTFGPLLPSGDRSCLPSDNSPVGTVHAGFIKVQSMGIFGASCSWTEVK